MFNKRRSNTLSKQEQESLLALARKTIEAKLNDSPPPEVTDASSYLKNGCGAFVTLTKNDNLRGCIGLIKSPKPLGQTIQEAAEAAAFKDPRFPPLNEDELKDIRIEISVISPLQKISSIRKIKVRRHGLFIKKGAAQGLLLPQVAAHHDWDRQTFLEHVCLKAGLEKDAWKEPESEIMVFDAQVFEEEPE